MNTPTTTPIEFGPPQISSLEAVLEHVWDDERRDYHANPRPGHVFVELVRLRGWLSLRHRAATQPMSTYKAALIADGTETPESEEEYLAAWQHLVDTGVAWQLQGFVGRMARDFIEAGLIYPPGDPDEVETKTEG